jgi:hypothetical protein
MVLIAVVQEVTMQAARDSYRTFRRVTWTPAARLTTISQLLAFVARFRCREHAHRAYVQQVVNGCITYGACCEWLLDVIDRELQSSRVQPRAISPAL